MIHKTRKSTIHVYSYLLWFQDESGSPGLVAAVSVDGQLVWTEGYDINQFLILFLPWQIDMHGSDGGTVTDVCQLSLSLMNDQVIHQSQIIPFVWEAGHVYFFLSFFLFDAETE